RIASYTRSLLDALPIWLRVDDLVHRREQADHAVRGRLRARRAQAWLADRGRAWRESVQARLRRRQRHSQLRRLVRRRQLLLQSRSEEHTSELQSRENLV